MKKNLSVFIFILLTKSSFSQGGIEHIKTQDYLKYSKNIDCNNQPGDNLTQRICANLAYQKSDSLLVVVYNKLLKETVTPSAKEKIIQLQKEWRALRDKHCSILWESYGTPAGSNASINILNCLTLLTNNRIKELELLLQENL